MQCDLTSRLREMGRRERASLDRSDLAIARRLKWSTCAAELVGRASLLFGSGPVAWIVGVAGIAYYLSVEAQLNHSIMHGAYARIPGAGRFTPDRYETLAIPFQSKTWRDAHRIHHGAPSIVGDDPDTIHPLFRVHASTRWRWWHAFNAFAGCILTFECWAYDYDRFLKRTGHRNASDRGELLKFARYVAYQYVLFPLLAGDRWREVLAASLVATVIRNVIFTVLQTASSVGAEVSTAHALPAEKKRGVAYIAFQIETSKNFVLVGIGRLLCGGLHRHIEHHLFPYLPPNRLDALSTEVRALAYQHGIRYAEYGTVWSSLGDSVAHLHRLAKRSHS